LISSICSTSARAEILNPGIVNEIVSSPVTVFGKTYSMQVEDKTFNIYYGFKFTYTNVTNISLVTDSNSIQITLKGVTEADGMWIQFPQNLMSAEKNNFVLYVDGQEKKYVLATTDHSTTMEFMLPANAALVEIQGTHIVPEFPLSSTSVMMIGFVTIMILGTKIKSDGIRHLYWS
jgi:hypothetical protein